MLEPFLKPAARSGIRRPSGTPRRCRGFNRQWTGRLWSGVPSGTLHQHHNG